MAPGLAVTAIFVFVQQWGDFFIPFILLYGVLSKFLGGGFSFAGGLKG